MSILRSGFCLGLALALLLAALPGFAEEESAAPKVSIGEKGFRIESADGQFKFKFGGRVHADATLHIGDTPSNGSSPYACPPGQNCDATDGVELRRARFLAKATVYEDWHWVGEIDFGDNKTSVKDFNITYSGFDGVVIGLGNQKQPYSLALEMSSNDLPFSERGVDTVLVSTVLDRAIGIRADANGERWFVAGGFFGDSVEPQKDNSPEGWGTSAKFVVTPIRDADSVLHLGFRAAYRQPESGNEQLRFRDETTNMSNYRVVDTTTLEDVQEIILFGPEAAWAHGRFSVFGEYNRAMLRRKNLDTAIFDSGHIGMAVSLTGESRAASYTIKSGEFKRLKPTSRFGAWELAARYAFIDLNSGGSSNVGQVNGGSEQAFTTSLNWYPNEVVRFVLSWKHILETDISSSVNVPPPNARYAFNQEGKGLNALTFRAQFAF